jgi:hypothetical protein
LPQSPSSSPSLPSLDRHPCHRHHHHFFPSAARSRCSSSPAVHRPTLTLPLLVDCCFFTLPADGRGGVGGIICPSYSADSTNSPSSSL